MYHADQNPVQLFLYALLNFPFLHLINRGQSQVIFRCWHTQGVGKQKYCLNKKKVKLEKFLDFSSYNAIFQIS